MRTKRIHPLVAILGNAILDKFGAQPQSSFRGNGSGVPELVDIPTIQRLKRKQGAVVLILGKRESGKTVLAQRLAQILERPTYAVSPEQRTPDWIQELKLEEIAQRPPPYSTLILDDIPAYFSSRDYTNPLVRIVEQLIPVVRHRRRIILIFSSQSSGQSDKWCMDADLVLMKPLNFLYPETERGAVKKLADKVMPIFAEMSEYQQKRHCYIFSDGYVGLARIQHPSQMLS